MQETYYKAIKQRIFFEGIDRVQSDNVYAVGNPIKTVYSAVPENLECDILIVGGGLAGLSLAYQFAKHGQKFLLIEAQTIGEAASGINGGFCSPGWSSDFDTLSAQFGREAAHAFYRLSIEGLRWMQSFKDKHEFKLMDVKGGIVSLSMLKSEKAAQKDFFDSDRSFSNEYQFISRNELRDYVRSQVYQSGVLNKSGFSFNPLNFLIGLKNTINLSHPNIIFENSKMKNFFESDKFCQINLTNGKTIRARKLVIATGGYGGIETGFLRTRWLPITTSIAVTSPLSNEVREIINPNFAFSDDRRAGNYFRLIGDNQLLWGRGISAFKSPDPKRVVRDANKDIQKFFPTLEETNRCKSLKFDFAWSGKMAYSKSMMPYVGRLTPRTYALTGFGGHGMNTAPAAAIVLAEHFLGLSNRISIFKKIPYKWNGFKIGPLAAEATYRMMAVKDVINQLFISINKK